MKRIIFAAFAALALLAAVSDLCGLGEKTLTIGAGYGWEAMETRQDVIEVSLARPHPVLALSSAGNSAALYGADLYLSFDEGNVGRFADSSGRWQVQAGPGADTTDFSLARSGAGAVRFSSGNLRSGTEPLTAIPGKDALFAPGSRVGDFSIEFWLYPLNLENGEQILAWVSSSADGRGDYIVQSLQCVVSRNRLQWNFGDFFCAPDGRDRTSLSFSGSSVMPKTWSHHVVRFDSGTGLLEYLINGRVDVLAYASSTGREGGEVYTPLMGEDGSLVLGGRFSGLMDEFRLYGSCIPGQALVKFPRSGRVESRTLDLGSEGSSLLQIEVFGGQTSASAPARNYFAGSTGETILRFSDYSEIQVFIRANDTPYRWNDVPWIPVLPGEDISSIRGRYIQAAVDFYPSGDGETTPYLDALNIIYRSAEPPPPPAMVMAVAGDGAVELSWRPSSSGDLGGYLVYFGTSGGVYMGDHAILDQREAVSPIDAGNRTSVRIEGLKNGTLYYFAVAAYDKILHQTGEFSREIAARPLPAILR